MEKNRINPVPISRLMYYLFCEDKGKKKTVAWSGIIVRIEN